jgi:hypothetical protein
MIKRPGRQPTYSERRLFTSWVEKIHPDEKTIIHHVTEDMVHRLQLEIERRSPDGITFERLVLTP